MSRPPKSASHAEYVAWCKAEMFASVPTWSDAALKKEASANVMPELSEAARAELRRRAEGATSCG